MYKRRIFLKAVGVLPFIFLGKKEVVKPEVCKAGEICRPEACSELPVIYQHWRYRWWRSQGNKVEWTDLRNHPTSPASKSDFINFNIIDNVFFDYCEALMPYQDYLLWIGKKNVWQIDYDYSMCLQQFMFTFRYKCDRKYLNVMIHHKYLNVMIHHDFGFME